jgi:hypothetical protein
MPVLPERGLHQGDGLGAPLLIGNHRGAARGHEGNRGDRKEPHLHDMFSDIPFSA